MSDQKEMFATNTNAQRINSGLIYLLLPGYLYDYDNLTPMESVPNRRSRHGLKDFPCPNCKRSYFHKRHLARHMRHECSRPARYACVSCAFKSYYKRDLSAHCRREHGIQKETNELFTNFLH